jgi:hypothetical protein
MRKTINTKETERALTLEELIPQYVTNKNELDSYDAICKKENAEIKRLMQEQKLTEKQAGGYVAKCTVSTRETVNEDKMLELLKADWIKRNGTEECPYIKSKEYIDMDALEAALYNSTIPEDVVVSLDTCRESKEVVSLRISKAKNKEAK